MSNRAYIESIERAAADGLLPREDADLVCYYARRYEAISDAIARKFPPDKDRLMPPADYWALTIEVRRDWLRANSEAVTNEVLDKLRASWEHVGWKTIP